MCWCGSEWTWVVVRESDLCVVFFSLSFYLSFTHTHRPPYVLLPVCLPRPLPLWPQFTLDSPSPSSVCHFSLLHKPRDLLKVNFFGKHLPSRGVHKPGKLQENAAIFNSIKVSQIFMELLLGFFFSNCCGKISCEVCFVIYHTCVCVCVCVSLSTRLRSAKHWKLFYILMISQMQGHIIFEVFWCSFPSSSDHVL